MNYITLFVLFSLLAGLAALYFFQIRRVKKKLEKVMVGKSNDRQLRKLLSKAQELSKINFFVHLWLSQSLIYSGVSIAAMVVLDLLILDNEADMMKYLISFIILFVTSTFYGFVMANIIWKKCHLE